jgi:hypothetical protein
MILAEKWPLVKKWGGAFGKIVKGPSGYNKNGAASTKKEGWCA